MLFHYGARNDVLPWEEGPEAALGFPVRVAKLAGEWATKAAAGSSRVLEVRSPSSSLLLLLLLPTPPPFSLH
eukprot:895423-Rhodomonas_salina.2